jgi:hypothetical protein
MYSTNLSDISIQTYPYAYRIVNNDNKVVYLGSKLPKVRSLIIAKVRNMHPAFGGYLDVTLVKNYLR